MNKYYISIFLILFSFISTVSNAETVSNDEIDKRHSPIYFEKNGCLDSFPLDILHDVKNTLLSGTWGITPKMEEVKVTPNVKLQSLSISDFYFINSPINCKPNTILLIFKPLKDKNNKYSKIKFCLSTYDGKKIKYSGRTHYVSLYDSDGKPFPKNKIVKELIHSSLLLYFK